MNVADKGKNELRKERLDDLLVGRGFFANRQEAQRSIMAGLVLVNKERIDKAGTKVPVNASIEIKGKKHRYVSRGGLKLEEAFRIFPVKTEGRIMLDIGASTGGFTDCALQNGVGLVYAVDVSYGELAWKLRQDPRVVVLERTNFRYLQPERLTKGRPDLAAIDVSFISLSRILPNLKNLLQPGGEVIALVKPQFEADREQVGEKGVVKDPEIHRKVLSKFVDLAHHEGFQVMGLAPSPIQGAEGNIEFLGYLVFRSPQTKKDWADQIDQVVKIAHERFSN